MPNTIFTIPTANINNTFNVTPAIAPAFAFSTGNNGKTADYQEHYPGFITGTITAHHTVTIIGIDIDGMRHEHTLQPPVVLNHFRQATLTTERPLAYVEWWIT